MGRSGRGEVSDERAEDGSWTNDETKDERKVSVNTGEMGGNLEVDNAEKGIDKWQSWTPTND